MRQKYKMQVNNFPLFELIVIKDLRDKYVRSEAHKFASNATLVLLKSGKIDSLEWCIKTADLCHFYRENIKEIGQDFQTIVKDFDFSDEVKFLDQKKAFRENMQLHILKDCLEIDRVYDIIIQTIVKLHS